MDFSGSRFATRSRRVKEFENHSMSGSGEMPLDGKTLNGEDWAIHVRRIEHHPTIGTRRQLRFLLCVPSVACKAVPRGVGVRRECAEAGASLEVSIGGAVFALG